MPRVRQIFCADMQTASVKVGNASWSSATFSMVIPAAMHAATSNAKATQCSRCRHDVLIDSLRPARDAQIIPSG